MSKLTYSEQLKHPNWQRKRLDVLQEARFACDACGDTETTLNVHHRRYVKGRKVWEYEIQELQCLCEHCHQEHHEHRALLDAILMDPDVSLPAVIGLVGGFVEGNLSLDESIAADVARVGDSHFDLGILASILVGMPDTYHRAAKVVGDLNLTPPQEQAIERWEDFYRQLERSGL